MSSSLSNSNNVRQQRRKQHQQQQQQLTTRLSLMTTCYLFLFQLLLPNDIIDISLTTKYVSAFIIQPNNLVRKTSTTTTFYHSKIRSPIEKRNQHTYPSTLFSTTEAESVASSSSSSSSVSNNNNNIDTDTTAASDSIVVDNDVLSYQAPILEINRRRNLAIISHPDSGKTTMTEKLLLYGGAIQQAGAVRQKADQRSTASDFMEIEQQRGISISSTVMNFNYNGYEIRLMDTPGHNDFSEDTYRALAAADNALMLLDGAKGLEPQTRKLFEVCRLRQLPLFTFVNKLDRPSLSPYEIMDQISNEFNLDTYPIFWPIGDGERFRGIVDRTTNIVHFYTKALKRGGKAIDQYQVSIHDKSTIQELLADDNELFDKLYEDLDVLNELINPLNMTKVLLGEQSPLFFGSAMTNFGVELFLQTFCTMGTRPVGRTINSNSNILNLFSPSSLEPMTKLTTTTTTTTTPSIDTITDNDTTSTIVGPGITTTTSSSTSSSTDNDDDTTITVQPEYEEFTGFIFKTQANLDPKHRDRLAYVRVVSGTYKKGMKVSHSRSKQNKKYNLAQAQALFGNDRTSIDVAYPGDVIGINNPGCFAIGDTLYTGSVPILFPGIPSFSPEKFAYIRAPNPSDYKSFRKGIDQLLDEGAVQALRQRNDDYNSGPLLLAAVGQLQFDVVQARLLSEYNVQSIFEPLSYTIARWVSTGTSNSDSTSTSSTSTENNISLLWDAVKKADDDGKLFGTMIVQDRWKRPVILFRNDWKAAAVEKEELYLHLQPWSYPPIATD